MTKPRMLSDLEVRTKIAALAGRDEPISRATLWRERAKKEFPKPVVVTAGFRATPEDELDSYLANRPRAGK